MTDPSVHVTPPSLAVVMVLHDSAPDISRSLPALAAQLRDGDAVVIVDSASRDDGAALAARLLPSARIVAVRGERRLRGGLQSRRTRQRV